MMGGPGTGRITKLLNNASLLANLRNAEEIVELGASLGLDAPNLVRVLQTGSGTSFALESWPARSLRRCPSTCPRSGTRTSATSPTRSGREEWRRPTWRSALHQSVDAFARARALVA